MKVLRITPERCTGCMRCELACSYMQTGTFQPAKSVIRISPFEAHTSYAPYTCTQCAEAWCLVACPVEAITISPVGAKVVRDDMCVGCKLCTIACPYGTIFYNPDTEKPLSVISVREVQRVRKRVRPPPLNTSRRLPAIGWETSRHNARQDTWHSSLARHRRRRWHGHGT